MNPVPLRATRALFPLMLTLVAAQPLLAKTPSPGGDRVRTVADSLHGTVGGISVDELEALTVGERVGQASARRI